MKDESTRVKIEAKVAIYFNGRLVDRVVAAQYFSYDDKTENCYLDTARLRREMERAMIKTYRTTKK